MVMSKIFICGDPHGRFEHIVSAIDEFHPDAVVILGDLTPEFSLDEIFKNRGNTEVFWIPGNHDTDSDLIFDRLWRSRFSSHNLHGRVLDVCSVKVAGLGGVFRGQIWMPPGRPNYVSPTSFIHKIGKSGMWRGGLPRRHRSTIFPNLYERLGNMRATVLVTHEAPAVHPKGFKAIDDLANKLGVRYIFHAHQHQSRVYGQVGNVVIRGVGLRGIVDLEGNVIVPAQVDPRELEEELVVVKEKKPSFENEPKFHKPPASRKPRMSLRRKSKWFKNKHHRMGGQKPTHRSRSTVFAPESK